MRTLVYPFVAALMALFLLAPVQARIYTDSYYGHSVEPPAGWATESLKEDTDSVLRFTSPDQAAYGEVRAFHLPGPIELGFLIDMFEREAAQGGQRVGTEDESLDGLDGKLVVWRIVDGGTPIVLATFFAIDGPVGYMFVIITAEESVDRYSQTFDKMFESFKRGTKITRYSQDQNQAQNQPQNPTQQPPSTARNDANQQASNASNNTTSQQPDDPFAGLVAEPHPELGFVFVRYENWQADQPQPYQLRVGLPEYAPAMRPSVLIEALAGDAYPSVQAGAQDLMQQLRDMPDVQFDQDGPQLVPNMAENGEMMEGWSFGARYTQNGVPFRQLVFLFKRKQPSVYYGVYVTGPQELVNKYQPEMMRMLQAIQIVPFSR